MTAAFDGWTANAETFVTADRRVGAKTVPGEWMASVTVVRYLYKPGHKARLEQIFGGVMPLDAWLTLKLALALGGCDIKETERT